MRWQDYSEYIVHFTKSKNNDNGYNNSMSILSSQTIKAISKYGVGRNLAPAGATQEVVCFSEVPLHCLKRISERRSPYGIGFSKTFAHSKGVLPIWYVESNSEQHNAIKSLMKGAQRVESEEEVSPIWKLTPFIDTPVDLKKGSYRFEWEREWRCIGDFHFCSKDVAFLVLPEDLHLKAKQFFKTVRDENLGPNYDCPFLDPNWSEEQVQRAMCNSQDVVNFEK